MTCSREDKLVLISLARVMLFREYINSTKHQLWFKVLISLARVMLFRAQEVMQFNRISICLNLSCESNAFQGHDVCEILSEGVSLNLSCESNAFQGHW